MYGDYILEKAGDGIIENERGFVTYRFLPDGKSVYILDVYIKPEFRRSGAMSAFGDEVVGIAKQRGCTELIGTVVPSLAGSTISLMALVSYGMKLHASFNDQIVFKKEI